MDTQVTDFINSFKTNEPSATGLTYTTLYGIKETFTVIPERLGEFFEGMAGIIEDDIHVENIDKTIPRDICHQIAV